MHEQGTGESSEKNGSPNASFLMQVWVLYMENGLENFLEDAPLCCSTESWPRQLQLPVPGRVLLCSLSLKSSSGICSQRESARIRSGRSIQNSGTPVDAEISIFSLVTGPLGSPSGAGVAC